MGNGRIAVGVGAPTQPNLASPRGRGAFLRSNTKRRLMLFAGSVSCDPADPLLDAPAYVIVRM